MVILNGKVSPNAMGIYNPGSAFGAASRIAAGTAIYEALAASIANIKRLPVSMFQKLVSSTANVPLTKGMMILNVLTNQPY